MIATCPVRSAACHVTRVRGKVAARVTGPGDTGHLILLQPLRNKFYLTGSTLVRSSEGGECGHPKICSGGDKAAGGGAGGSGDGNGLGLKSISVKGESDSKGR